jgi:hypothetical protein
MTNIIKCMRCKNNIIGSDICSDSNRKFCEDCLIIANNKISKKIDNLQKEYIKEIKNCLKCKDSIIKHNTCYDSIINGRFCKDCSKDFDNTALHCYFCLDQFPLSFREKKTEYSVCYQCNIEENSMRDT